MVVNPLGAAVFHVQNLKSNKYFTLKLIILDEDFTPPKGRQAVEQIGLIKVNHDHFVGTLCLSNICEKYSLFFLWGA